MKWLLGIVALALPSLLAFTVYVPSVAAPPLAGQPSVVVLTLDPSLAPFEADWKIEIARRFPNAVAILCHGGYYVRGEWIVQPFPGKAIRITDEVAQVQQDYPGRTVVVLACNTDHFELHGLPNVYYAGSSVWCIPDRADVPGKALSRASLDDADFIHQLIDEASKPVANRSVADPDLVGNIFEFQEAK